MHYQGADTALRVYKDDWLIVDITNSLLPKPITYGL